ncbi:MAG: hypothetical protein IJ679_02705 [Lachnospiraceae bacterium]|nr:hypothetical protein [Lachnospiraceae bacterium]
MNADRINKQMLQIEIGEKGTPLFYTETVNIVGQYRRLKRKPTRKLINYFVQLKLNMAICLAVLAFSIWSGWTWGWGAIEIAGSVIMLFCIILNASFLASFIRLKNNLLKDERTSVLTLDDKGIELNKSNAQIVCMSWENVDFVRSFKETVCFFAKDEMGFVITVAKRYEKDILEYIQRVHPALRVI